MKKSIMKKLLVVVGMMMAAGMTARAVPPPEPLDRSLSDAELVVVGTLGKLTPVEGTNQTSGEISVAHVCKGPATLKTVTLLTVAPGEPLPLPRFPPPVIRQEGDEGIWLLTKHGDFGGKVRCSRLQPMASLDDVKLILEEQAKRVPLAAKPASEPLTIAGTYESGDWTYRYDERTSWRSAAIDELARLGHDVGRTPKNVYKGGGLAYAGVVVRPDDKQTCILTPWGWLRWINTSRSGVGCLWIPEPEGDTPAADQRLPDPIREPEAFARSQRPPAPVDPATAKKMAQDMNDAKQRAIEEERRRIERSETR